MIPGDEMCEVVFPMPPSQSQTIAGEPSDHYAAACGRIETVTLWLTGIEHTSHYIPMVQFEADYNSRSQILRHSCLC